MRVLDGVLIGLFVAMAFFAISTDTLQSLGSTGGISRKDFHGMPIPDKWLDIIDWWLTHDLLLKANPLWYRLMAVVSPTLYLPFVRFDLHCCASRTELRQYALAIYAIWNKKEWIRMPAICWATALVRPAVLSHSHVALQGYSMVIIMAEEFFGEHATPSPLLIAGCYGPYAVAPFLVWYRMYSAPLFSKHKSERSASPAKARANARKSQ